MASWTSPFYAMMQLLKLTTNLAANLAKDWTSSNLALSPLFADIRSTTGYMPDFCIPRAILREKRKYIAANYPGLLPSFDRVWKGLNTVEIMDFGPQPQDLIAAGAPSSNAFTTVKGRNMSPKNFTLNTPDEYKQDVERAIDIMTEIEMAIVKRTIVPGAQRKLREHTWESENLSKNVITTTPEITIKGYSCRKNQCVTLPAVNGGITCLFIPQPDMSLEAYMDCHYIVIGGIAGDVIEYIWSRNLMPYFVEASLYRVKDAGGKLLGELYLTEQQVKELTSDKPANERPGESTGERDNKGDKPPIEAAPSASELLQARAEYLRGKVP